MSTINHLFCTLIITLTIYSYFFFYLLEYHGQLLENYVFKDHLFLSYVQFQVSYIVLMILSVHIETLFRIMVYNGISQCNIVNNFPVL